MVNPIGCVKEIGKCILWPHVKRHFDYWWCFDNNIQGLRDGIQDLDRQTFDMDQKIEQARLRTENLRPGVKDWSNAGTEKLKEARRILQDDNIPKAWNLISRYSMGKSAKQTAEEIAKLRNDGIFDRISDPVPPPSMGSTSHRPTKDFASRNGIEEGIIETLRSCNVSMIGICGMGGVGKTTMVKRIWKRVMEEKLVDEVVMVVVSQQVVMLKIQEEIAELLGLKFGDVNTLSARANILRTRLEDTKKKIIIFDDVWKSLKLEDLGVPIETGFDKCKIILTTRSNDICREMEAQEVIAMEVLTEEEAWSLFKEKAGNCVEDSILLSVAKDVVAECKGLPIALVTVGKALHNKKDKRIWEDSLSQLRRSNPTDFKQVEEYVYKPLKLSYDYLDNERERRLFLLCCLFPEDYDISVEQLAWYCMGLQMFGKLMSVEETRNRTHTLVEKLKSRFLLLDGDYEHHVKMHDVVRDVAIFIGSEEKRGFLKSLEVTSMDSLIENSSGNCNWMSANISNEIIDLPLGMHFPNLRLLMTLKSTSDKVSFEGMADLNVLSFSEIEFTSLPPTLGLLKNLRTLRLYSSKVRNISVVGVLASLEILSCIECENIEELPEEIGRLKSLRFLELYECYQLETIAFGIISSLVQLEELKIIGSFSGWEAEEKGKETRNAALTELQSLPNLTRLEIQIDDWNLAAQDICLPQKLVKYYIHISDSFYYDGGDCEKAIHLNLPRNITIGKWIHKLVRNTEHLELEGDGSNNFNLAESQSLRNLKFSVCSTVKKLVNTIDCKFGTVFPLLERLELYKLEMLEEICDGTIPEESSISFQYLKEISIMNCSNLRSLFSVEMARNLLQLEDLYIYECNTMEEVLWNENKSITSASIEFPKLKKLRLEDLPNLIALCQGVESIHFPNLTEMDIRDLPKLRSLCDQKGSNLWNTPNHQNASLCNLTSIFVEKCSNLRYLFSVEMARSLLQLEFLHIEDCDKMEEVFWNSIEFPKLKTLELSFLPNLTALCQGVESIHFPKLTEMTIAYLPMLNSLFNLKGSNLWKTSNQNASLCNLTSIFIMKCSNLHNLFSVEMARSLLQLEKLEIFGCDTMEQVFWNENKSITSASIEFPKLKKLRLEDLPNLTAFCQGVESIHFPNLTKMGIDNLPKLNSVVPLNSEPPHEDTSFHFLCNQKVEIGGLKELTLQELNDNISYIWCHHIPINFFRNLEELTIFEFNGIRNLISSSIAVNLVSLKCLSIKSCRELVEVIEVEKETFDLSLFPTLRVLEIKNLLKLRSFCQWKHALELSSLEVVKIHDCPKMETFTLGSLRTPNIKEFSINKINIGDTLDLNGVIHDFRTKSCDEDEDEDEELEEDSLFDENKEEDNEYSGEGGKGEEDKKNEVEEEDINKAGTRMRT